MSDRVIRVDFEGVESGGGKVRVPEGDYGLKIDSIKSKKGEDSGKPFLEIRFELIKGDKRGLGKKVPNNYSLQKQALWNLRNLLESCGKQVPAKTVKINLDNLIGLECAGTLIDEEYEGRKHSVISAVFPMADLNNTSEGDEFMEDEGEEKPKGKLGKTGKGKPKKEEESVEEDEEGSEEADELFN